MQSLILVHPDKAYADSVNQSLACRFEGKLTIVRSDSCEDALRYWLEQQMPDIILTAADPGDYSGMELYREARSHDTRVRVILLADVPDTAQMMEAIRGGAEDYILREEGFERIADAVQRTMQAVQAEAQAAMTAIRTASARPLIDRDILHRLMAANHQKLCAIKAEMDIWHYPCRNHQPVALGCCFFPRLDFPSARARVRIEHMASPSVELIGIEYDDHTLVVMCYTREGNPIHILKECLRTMCMRSTCLFVLWRTGHTPPAAFRMYWRT